ncbi:MAG: hypothetical protein M1815_003497 [Lichina confinis]|nr:MAG: hypothetical protein M1815_003497 [Lichina confinis]
MSSHPGQPDSPDQGGDQDQAMPDVNGDHPSGAGPEEQQQQQQSHPEADVAQEEKEEDDDDDDAADIFDAWTEQQGTTAFDALEKGFDDLMDLCDVVMDKFTTARNEHRQRNAR